MKPAIMFLFMLLLSGLARAQWEQTNGPLPVLTETSFASMGNLMFVATELNRYWPGNNGYGNVYRSRNNGINWEKAILSQEPGSVKAVIDLSGRGKGVYFIRIITSEGVSVKKVMLE